jgi:hypothetical protein
MLEERRQPVFDRAGLSAHRQSDLSPPMPARALLSSSRRRFRRPGGTNCVAAERARRGHARYCCGALSASERRQNPGIGEHVGGTTSSGAGASVCTPVSERIVSAELSSAVGVCGAFRDAGDRRSCSAFRQHPLLRLYLPEKSEVRALHATSISPLMFRTQAQKRSAVRLDPTGGKTRGSGCRVSHLKSGSPSTVVGRLR